MDTLKSKIYSGVMYVVNGSKSNCMLKGLVSGVMGIGMGLSLGVFFGTFEGCHGHIPGNTMREQLIYATKQTVVCTYRRCVNYAATFGLMGVVLTSSICEMAKIRGKDDQWNSIAAGAITGGAWGAVVSRRQPAKIILKESAKCAFGFVLFGIVMDYVIDSFQDKAAWTRPFTPHSICRVCWVIANWIGFMIDGEHS